MQLPHINRFGWDSQMQHRNLEVVSHSWYAANSFRVRGSIKAHKGFADSGHDTSVFNPLEESSSSQETSHLSPRGGGFSLKWPVRGGSARKRYLFQASGI